VAVSIFLRSGQELGAVLISMNEEVQFFERWTRRTSLPSDELATVPVMEIATVIH
jgi:hypothetical protein